MFIHNLKSVALSVPEIIWGTQSKKIVQSLDTPTLPYLQNFLWAFIRIGPENVLAKFEIRSFTRSRDNRGTQKIWAVPGYAHAPISANFNGHLFGLAL